MEFDHMFVVLIVCALSIIVGCNAGCSDTTYQVAVTKTRRESYASTYYASCGFMGWSRCQRTRTNYRVGYYTAYETRNCPTDGGKWGDWSAYSTCSNLCGGGTMTRSRICGSSSVTDCCAKCNGQKTQTQTVACNTHSCPVDGGWSDWKEGNWEECPETCNGEMLVRTDTRTCTNPAPAHGGKACDGDSTKTSTKSCHELACPVNGGWSDWTLGQWEECPDTCGSETLTRTDTRTCTNPAPANDGKLCEGNSIKVESVGCFEHGCPVNGGWSDWTLGQWDECPYTCGTETLTRTDTRTCTNPAPANNGKLCEGNNNKVETVSCFEHGCPVNGGWSDWTLGQWDECPYTCGSETLTRTDTRTCTNPAPANDGKLCEGNNNKVETVSCFEHGCPVHGGWSDWTLGQWDECPYTCGSETLTRTDTRTCTNPAPANDGNLCEGNSNKVETVSCFEHGCPVHGNWSDWDAWSTWSSCSTTCDDGTRQRSRSRTCTNPEPANGGNICTGQSTEGETETCNIFECPDTRCKRIGTDFTDHPDPQKCNQYLHCNAGTLNTMTCPPTTAWNNEIKSCDVKSAASCLGTCTHGNYEAHPDCTKYYQCAAGTKVEISCKNGTRWNDVLMICDHPENVDCNGQSEDENSSENTEKPTCSCSVNDPTTTSMCKAYLQSDCDACINGQIYAHNEDNCRFYFICAYGYLIEMPNPPQQFWDKESNSFRVETQDLNDC